MTKAEYDEWALMVRDVWGDIALMIRDVRDNEHIETSWDALDRVVSRLIEIFEWDPSFDKDKFGDICTGD